MVAQVTGKYIYYGAFRRDLFESAFNVAFARNPRYDANAIPALMQLVGFMEEDERVYDIRWMAYMLATVFWETASLKHESVRVLNKKKQPLLDARGQPLMRTVKHWRITMRPVAEVGHGAGRRYYLPVKVKAVSTVQARVTEQDGDQFLVSSAGAVKPITKKAKLGSDPNAESSDVYDEDDGQELAYYGRGYVQLTWWSNYAKSGVGIGRGLELLFNPELVTEPETAYAIMAHGMITGKGFANGHKLSDYFDGPVTDYVQARAMVNGTDKQFEIAEVAKTFEGVLMGAKE
jgi:hypothetical protein